MNCIRFFYTIADFNKYQMTEDFIGSEQDMVKPIHVTCAGPDSQVLKINYCSAYDKIIFATARAGLTSFGALGENFKWGLFIIKY